MDNSQSFNGACRVYNNNMNTIDYESLVCSTKKALENRVHEEIKKSTFISYFNNLLEDCRLCISKSFDLINNIISSLNVDVEKLIEYINDSLCLLKMLSDFINAVIQLFSLSCFNTNTFPISTGHIIKIVFLHCKESDSIYGTYLTHVAKHLKDLFRTCHELQLTYLMVLENHFSFDLNENEQMNILDEALQINLEIGEIVEILDIKTMAEQWKAYTSICEKHYYGLIDKQTYNNCTKVLCQIIEKNITSASEYNQNDKVTLRAVKVSSFMMKMLLKMINIFKNSTLKHQENILNLLIFLYLKTNPHIEPEKFAQFTNLMHTDMLGSIEALLRELLLDETFVNCLFNYEIDSMKKEDNLLGYILLILSFIKLMIQYNNNSRVIFKQKVIRCIYRCLPQCHIWFNMSGLKFNLESTYYQSQGLFENVLTHMTALAMTLTAEDYYILEGYVIEALLGTQCLTALFSSNLLVLLARFKSSQLLTKELISLCKIYRNSERNVLFQYSPQRVHLRYTIGRLFEFLEKGDKITVYNEFSYSNENFSLLCLLNVQSLPNDVRNEIKENVYDNLKLHLQKLSSDFVGIEEMDKLVNYMDLVASCHFPYVYDLGKSLLNAWAKLCFEDGSALIQGNLDRETLWLYEYIRALVSLTYSWRQDFCANSDNIVKILHILLNLTKSRNAELNLTIINLFSYLIEHNTRENNNNKVEYLNLEIFKYLTDDNNDCNVRVYLLCSLKKRFKESKHIGKIITIVRNDDRLKQIWDSDIKRSRSRTDIENYTEKLRRISKEIYTHKCIENKDVKFEYCASQYEFNQHNGNFDLADDIDTLFENESEPEPVCKKVKFNNNDGSETDVIITNLENEVFKLTNQAKQNDINCKQAKRIYDICNKLKSITQGKN